jgi:breast cancer 2 susceptibility protein
MTPKMAVYYSFHSSAYPSPTPSNNPITSSWGPSEALQELLRLGCTLVTKAWVDNHWGLVLWKIAGMVCLDPDTESDSTRRRWTWTHVIHQLLYRLVSYLCCVIITHPVQI